MLLEHPLFRDTLKSKGLLKKYEDILNSKSGNLICYDGDDFLDYVLESDVLVGETTSLMAEYLIANKPIILVGDYSCLNEFGKTLIEPDNAVITFHELKKRLKKLCHNSEISFENKRLFKPADNRSSADYLLEFLKTDFDSITDYFIELNKRLTNELDGIEKILTQGYYSDGFLDKNSYNSETVANLLKVWSDSLVRLQTALQSKENQQ